MFAPSFVQSVIVKNAPYSLYCAGQYGIATFIYRTLDSSVPADPVVAVKATLPKYNIVTFFQTLLIVIGGGNANRFCRSSYCRCCAREN